MEPSSSQRISRFGLFELDLRSRELRKDGSKVKLQDQPFLILAALLEKPGELVTREELRQRIWSADTFVDFDIGLNTAISRLRNALGDPAENPRFVETLPRLGYRFIAPVDSPLPRALPGSADTGTAQQNPSPATGVPWRPRRVRHKLVGLLVLSALAAVAASMKVGRVRDRLFGTSASTRIQSIAVLPLKNLSKDPEQDYFAEGMTETLVTELGQVRGLRVISRTSVMRYKDTTKSLREIARELQVDALVEGTVARSGDRVRITANLIQASPERHLWAKSYERDLRDTLRVQGEVAQAVADQINITLTPQQRALLPTTHAVDREAYELYLRGRYFFNRRTQENLKKAEGYFQQAIDKDPSFAPAYAGLGHSVSSEAFAGHRPNEVMPRAKTLVSKALEMDESLAEAHEFMASIHLWYDFDWPGAEREFRRALELNPNDAAAHQFFASYFIALGQFERARIELERAHQLDPLSVFYITVRCLDYHLMREDDHAIEECGKALEMDPNFARAHGNLAGIYEHQGMYDRSFQELEKAATLEGEDAKVIVKLKSAYDSAGIRGLWKRQLELGKEISRRDYVDPLGMPFGMVFACAKLGEKDQALAWLQVAYEERSPGLVGLKVEPGLDPLRSDSRFQALLRRMGLPP